MKKVLNNQKYFKSVIDENLKEENMRFFKISGLFDGRFIGTLIAIFPNHSMLNTIYYNFDGIKCNYLKEHYTPITEEEWNEAYEKVLNNHENSKT